MCLYRGVPVDIFSYLATCRRGLNAGAYRSLQMQMIWKTKKRKKRYKQTKKHEEEYKKERERRREGLDVDLV